jgi:RimJ/RimL family protein N-acetyltransferase
MAPNLTHTPPIELETPRLRLRAWRQEDLAPFAALNADPQVMEFFPALLNREASDASAAAIQAQLQNQGWGLWAAENKASREFMGFIGLSVPRRPLPFSPCVEVGWRLARPFWGPGLASEGAREALRCGFTRVGLTEIVSFTTTQNLRSMAVMARIGMQHQGERFEHPALPPGHPQRWHVLWRAQAASWLARAEG